MGPPLGKGWGWDMAPWSPLILCRDGARTTLAGAESTNEEAVTAKVPVRTFSSPSDGGRGGLLKSLDPEF